MTAADHPWPQEPSEAPAHNAPAVPAPPGSLRKRPLLAAILSLFPGLGQIYDGLYLRGVVLFMIFAGLISLVATQGNPFFGLGIAFTLFFSVLDAYRQALLINYGYAQDMGLTDLPFAPKASQGGIVAGVVLALIGLLALIDRFFYVDYEWLANLWPLGLIGVGVWLIVATMRERRKEREGPIGS